MPKYKVGDVAAFFPKPKESITETGKKLQSLFGEFHNKRNKLASQFHKDHPKVTTKVAKTDNEETKNQNSNSMQNKKRKVSASGSLKSDVNDIIKKFKVSNELEQIGFHIDKEGKTKNISSAEINFPRRKKKGKKSDNIKSNSFGDFGVAESLPEELGFVSNKFSNNLQSRKQVSGFIKKKKKQNESSGAENFNKKPLYTNNYSDALFKNENAKRKIKKLKKKKTENSASHVQNTGSVNLNQKKVYDLNEPDVMQLVDKKKTHKTDDGDMEKSEFVKLTQEKKINQNKRNLTAKNADDEELSRTLFVGNLPTNSTLKALRNFFSTFGEVEKVRYHPIETDKNKIFKHGGSKDRPKLNYAAESLLGFIVYTDRQSAVDALSLSGSLYQNRHITVDFARAPGSQKHYDAKRSIFLGNLPFRIQDEVIWNAFGGCGKIEGVRIVRDRPTGIGKGFGYIQFSSVQAQKNALDLEKLEIEGRPIRIKAVNSSHKQLADNTFVRRDPFKSRAISFKKAHKDTNSKKTVKKIMKKQKDLHKKKKIASLFQKFIK